MLETPVTEAVQPVEATTPAVPEPTIVPEPYIPEQPIHIPQQFRSRVRPKTESLSRWEQGQRDAKEAQEILGENFVDGMFTFPTTGIRVPIRELPEASYQRFILDVETMPPPIPPMKEIEGKKGRRSLLQTIAIKTTRMIVLYTIAIQLVLRISACQKCPSTLLTKAL